MALNLKEFVAGMMLLVLAATSAAGSWSGYVVEQTTNVPIDSVSAAAIHSNGTVYGPVSTAIDGFFNISGLPANSDTYDLSFQKAGWTATSLSGLPPLSVARPDRTFNPALMNVTMTRAMPGTASGTISNATGPLNGVSVTVAVSQGATVVNFTTTAGAAYSFPLIDGTYSITASAPGYFPQTFASMVITPNSTTTINFVLVSSTVLTGVTVAPASASLAPNATQQLTATAAYSDGSTADVTATAAWTSSNATAASVSATGLVTALVDGTAAVQAAYGGFNGQSAVTVSTFVPTPTPPAGGGGGGTYIPTPTPTPIPTPNATVTPTAAPSATPSPTASPAGTIDTQQYSVSVTVNGEAYEFLVSRQLVVEQDVDGGYVTSVIITIKSKGKTMTDFEFKELIPSAFGQPSAMAYVPQPTRLTSDGAIWKFSFLNAGDVLTLKYSKKGITPKSYATLWQAPNFYSTKPGVTAVTEVVTLPTPTQAPSQVPSASPASVISGFFTASNTQSLAIGAVVAVIVIALAAYVIKFRPGAAPAAKDGLRGAAKLKHEEKLRKLGSSGASLADKKAVLDHIEKMEREISDLKKQL